MVERGVRFVQIFHGGGGGGAWDAHAGIMANHSQLSSQVDLPIAGLLTDLKQRGLLDETIVVWGTEFGRSPGAQADGRDHHPQGFCAWLAGGGVKGGVVHGATDEIGFHAVEDRHYVTDIHATVMHQPALIPTSSKSPAASGSRSITASRSARSWRNRLARFFLHQGAAGGSFKQQARLELAEVQCSCRVVCEENTGGAGPQA